MEEVNLNVEEAEGKIDGPFLRFFTSQSGGPIEQVNASLRGLKERELFNAYAVLKMIALLTMMVFSTLHYSSSDNKLVAFLPHSFSFGAGDAMGRICQGRLDLTSIAFPAPVRVISSGLDEIVKFVASSSTVVYFDNGLSGARRSIEVPWVPDFPQKEDLIRKVAAWTAKSALEVLEKYNLADEVEKLKSFISSGREYPAENVLMAKNPFVSSFLFQIAPHFGPSWLER